MAAAVIAAGDRNLMGNREGLSKALPLFARKGLPGV